MRIYKGPQKEGGPAFANSSINVTFSKSAYFLRPVMSEVMKGNEFTF